MSRGRSAQPRSTTRKADELSLGARAFWSNLTRGDITESDLGLRILAVKAGQELEEIKWMIEGGLLTRCQRLARAYAAAGWQMPADLRNEPWRATASLIHRLREPRLYGDERLREEGRVCGNAARFPSVLIHASRLQEGLRRAHRAPQLYRGWHTDMETVGYEMIHIAADHSVFDAFCAEHRGAPQWTGIHAMKVDGRYRLAARIAWRPQSKKTISTVLLGPSAQTRAGLEVLAAGYPEFEGSVVIELTGLGAAGNPIRFAPTGSFPMTSSARVLGSDDCDHPHGIWSMNESRDAVHLGCHACGRLQIMAVPLHRVHAAEGSPAAAYHSAPDATDYVKAQAFYDALDGRRVMTTLEALRERDGLVSDWNPRSYASISAVRPGAGVKSVSAAMNRR